MAAVLHLLTGKDPRLALTTILRQLAAGDAVTVALLAGTAPAALPAAVPVHPVPGTLSYDQLLDLILAADQVITW